MCAGPDIHSWPFGEIFRGWRIDSLPVEGYASFASKDRVEVLSGQKFASVTHFFGG